MFTWNKEIRLISKWSSFHEWHFLLSGRQLQQIDLVTLKTMGRQTDRKNERKKGRQTDRVWKTDYLLFSVWMEGGNAWVKCMEIQWMIWYWLVCFDSSLFDCLWVFFSDRYGAFVLIIFCFVWWSKRELKRERNWVSLIFWMAFFFLNWFNMNVKMYLNSAEHEFIYAPPEWKKSSCGLRNLQ